MNESVGVGLYWWYKVANPKMTYSIVCGYPGIPLIQLENKDNQTTTKDVSPDKFNVEDWNSSTTVIITDNSIEYRIRFSFRKIGYADAGEFGCNMKYDMFPFESKRYYIKVHGECAYFLVF